MSEQNKDRLARDVENLVELFNRSEWDEMHLKTDDLEIFLSNDPNASLATTAAPSAPATASVSMSESVAPAASSSATSETTAPEASAAATVPEGMIAITAPNLGTFYRAPKPGAAPYVEVGQQVEQNTDVCLIEVMKLFTPVKAGVAGKVHAVCIDDGTMVEFGDALVIIDPS